MAPRFGFGFGFSEAVKSRNKIKIDQYNKAIYVSPHAMALQALAKKPELIKGKQEHYQQVVIFNTLEVDYPSIYELAYAVPNGGKRSKKTAFEMVAEGAKKGLPDMGIDCARGVYHGFRLELKSGRNTASVDQVDYADRLRNEGYCVVFAWEAEQALIAILEYMNLPAGGTMSKLEFKAPKPDKKTKK